MCVRRFQGRNTVGKNRGWGIATLGLERKTFWAVCAQLWELGNYVEENKK